MILQNQDNQVYQETQFYAHGDWSFERILQLKILKTFAYVVKIVCSFPTSKCLPSSLLGANFDTTFSWDWLQLFTAK